MIKTKSTLTKHIQWLFITFVMTAITACESNVQTSSGTDYLARYSDGERQSVQGSNDIDALVAKAANIEPNLRFPAKIGLVKISNEWRHKKELAQIPADELDQWAEFANQQGDNFGSFVPLNLLVADLTAKSLIPRKDFRFNISVIDKIRLGAARQHMDAVLIYETFSKDDVKGNALSLTNLTIIGAYIIPTKRHNAEGFASALLLDVRNGYPYLTATKTVQRNDISTAIGNRDRKKQLKNAVEAAAVSALITELANPFSQLKKELTKAPAQTSP